MMPLDDILEEAQALARKTYCFFPGAGLGYSGTQGMGEFQRCPGDRGAARRRLKQTHRAMARKVNVTACEAEEI